MANAWENWLIQHPEFSFAGKDSGDDVGEYDDTDVEDSGEDDDDADGDLDAEDDDDDAGPSDTARRLRNLEKENKRLSRELEAAVELLNSVDEGGSSSDDAPEGYVPQEDYDALVELLRTDYVQNAISSYTKRDGTPKWDWEDPSAVYKFLDVDQLEIDVKSRTIDGLEDQLADIAERYPFMLKNRGAVQKREGSGMTGRVPRRSGAREQSKNPSLEALVAEFPALVD